MKYKIWSAHLISALFAFILSVGAIGSLISGYGLPVDSLWKIYLWCALFAFVSSALLGFRYGGRAMVCLTALVLLVLWGKETFWQQMMEQIQRLCHILSSHYHHVYGWPILGNPSAKDVSIPLIFWAALVAVDVNFYICRRKHIVIAIIPTILPLVLCLLTTDKVPDTVYLYLVILGLAVLLITDWTRGMHPAQGVKLILRCTLPIAAALALIFAWNPREEYVNNAAKLQKEVVEWLHNFRNTAESIAFDTSTTDPNAERLNLRTVGPKNQIAHAVMRVNASRGGVIYLRGRDYDRYTGTGWEASSERKEEFTWGGASSGKLTIITYGLRNVLYVPYYATKEIRLTGGALENDENLQRYSYSLSDMGFGNSGIPDSRYTKLPDDTLDWGKDLVSEITGGITTDQEKILRIQNYVRSSAAYDLSTSRMDAEYSDFAKWFLDKSETGYCVHFATATAVLLRAAGIPARYVEGYMVNCGAGSEVIVSSQDAHAWTEYYDSDSNTWRILDATPADPDEETEPTTAIPEIETSPGETQMNTDTSATEATEEESLSTEPNRGNDDSAEDYTEQSVEKKPFWMPAWFKNGIKCLIIAVCIPIQACARMYWKQRLWNHGQPNERTIIRWRQTRSLAKLLKQQYPIPLDNLAQKAKFSQHKIQPDELQQFEDYRLSLTVLVAEKPWYLKCIFKWIFAIG